MEESGAEFNRILHGVVDEFIYSVTNYFSHEDLKILGMQKIFCEIVKRKESIIQELRNIAFAVSVKTSVVEKEQTVHGTNKLPELRNRYNNRIKNLVQNIFSQDLLEIALNGNESSNITCDKLHNVLYFGALGDGFKGGIKEILLDRPDIWLPAVSSHLSDRCKNEAALATSVFNPQLSLQFMHASTEIDSDVYDMGRVFTTGFSVSDLMKYNVATISKIENNDTLKEIKQKMQPNLMSLYEENEELLYEHDFAMLDPANSLLHMSEVEKLFKGEWRNKMESPPSISLDPEVRSWENALGREFLHEHAYISEVTPETVVRCISEKEYHTYNSLVNPADTISEDDMIRDILDVLIGIPSDTFFYDIHSRRFRMKSGVHLPNLSSECTDKVVAKFVESGSMYRALHNFSQDFLHASEGTVFKGMQHGIRQILSIYNEYIAAVKANSPTMLFLRNDVMKNAELLQNFALICGIYPERMIIKEIPKGLGLLSYLHDLTRSLKSIENGILIAVLLKYTYEPYLSFLNEWMTEGICNDPYNEFQIKADITLGKYDFMFWKFAFTENVGDLARTVPQELKIFSQDILNCGKSINLIKELSPDLLSRIFNSPKPLPSLSMVFSFPAAICKVGECMEYILFMENADSISNFKMSHVSDDKFYVESQKLINKKQMLRLVKRRCNTIFAGKAAKTNILDFKKVSLYLAKYRTDYHNEVHSSESRGKCDYLPVSATENKDILNGRLFKDVGLLFSSSVKRCMHFDVHVDNFKINFISSCLKDRDDNFSGKLYDNIGLLFSSCGYEEDDMKSDSLFKDTECIFSPLDFSKQLCLSSYSHYSYLTVDNTCNKFPSSRLGLWRSFCHSKVIQKALKNIRKSEHGERNFIKDMFSDPFDTDDLTFKEHGNFAKSDDKIKNSFLDKLASLLVSEYGDSIGDIYATIQVTSLQRLIVHNFQAVLKTRINVVETAIMKCMVKEYHLDSLLSSLRNIYFLQDETFSQSLCEPLFSRVMQCKTHIEFANCAILNEILENAISDSGYKYNLLFSLNMTIGFPPLDRPVQRTDFLHLLIIDFNVRWPLNIIVHHECIREYSRIFSMLLEIEFLCWLLGRTWKHLLLISKDLHLDDSPQFRTIMLHRFHMDQFVRVIRNSIHQHLQGPLWEFLQKGFSAEQSNIDNLESIHMEYLEKVLARCFLTDDTNVLHNHLSVMFHEVYNICSRILEYKWCKNEQTGYYETRMFRELIPAVGLYKYHQMRFVQLITRESLVKRFGRYWDRDYRDFLETIRDAEMQ